MLVLKVKRQLPYEQSAAVRRRNGIRARWWKRTDALKVDALYRSEFEE